MTRKSRSTRRSRCSYRVSRKDQERVKSQTSPEGIVTIMFTDMVGSTRQRVMLGDDYAQEIMRIHNRITRDAVRKHDGFEVKAAGDGFMFVFSTRARHSRRQSRSNVR